MITKDEMTKDVNSKINRLVESEVSYIDQYVRKNYKGGCVSFYQKIPEQDLTFEIKNRIMNEVMKAGWSIKYQEGSYDVRDGDSWPGSWIVS